LRFEVWFPHSADQKTKHGCGDDDEARVPAAYIIKLGVGQAANAVANMRPSWWA
jgi:hypothetical protein